MGCRISEGKQTEGLERMSEVKMVKNFPESATRKLREPQATKAQRKTYTQTYTEKTLYTFRLNLFK